LDNRIKITSKKGSQSWKNSFISRVNKTHWTKVKIKKKQGLKIYSKLKTALKNNPEQNHSYFKIKEKNINEFGKYYSSQESINMITKQGQNLKYQKIKPIMKLKYLYLKKSQKSLQKSINPIVRKTKILRRSMSVIKDIWTKPKANKSILIK